jgi:hypothetical protein
MPLEWPVSNGFLVNHVATLQAQRSEANRLDVICCAKSKTEDHDLDTPQGCCGVCRCGCCLKTQKQATWFENTFGEFVTSKVGIGITIAVFVALAVVGLIGCTKIYKDFKLEWFIPDDSYVTEYFTANAQYSEAGTRFFIYTPSEIDYFTEQSTRQNFATVSISLEVRVVKHMSCVLQHASTFTHFSGWLPVSSSC